MDLYYLRHGETVWNREGRLQGRGDSPLTFQGVQDVIAYGDWLSERVDAGTPIQIHASPLGRTRQTAALIADRLRLPFEDTRFDPLLAEIAVGEFEGLTWGEIERRFGLTHATWRRGETPAPGGESRADVVARAQQWWDTHYAPNAREDRIDIVVSHGGFSRALRAVALDLDLVSAAELSPHAHGCLYQVGAGTAKEHVIRADDA